MNQGNRTERRPSRRGGRRGGTRERGRPEGRPPQPRPAAREPIDPGCEAPLAEGPFVHIAFRGGRREAYANPEQLVLRCGDYVLVEAERGHDLGRVTVCEGSDLKRRRKQPVRAILRQAAQAEVERLAALTEEDRTAFESCRERVQHFGLPMKIIDAETQFDGNRITFFFTAERRVDFRDLVRDLAGIFRTRIELRQVGARDAARQCNDIGPCGRPLCCTGFLADFDPVTLKMAKEQNLPLNPAKISGSCGRLMCCLNYEAGAYQNARRSAPPAGSRWLYQGRVYTAGRFVTSRYMLPLTDEEGEGIEVGLDAFAAEAQPAPPPSVEAGEQPQDQPAE